LRKRATGKFKELYKIEGTVLGFYETGKLRNCTKLRNSLLGNGELASLAYGSLKELLQIEELYKIEEPRQGGLVVPFRSVLGDL
jgi:hypothetical protein